MGWLKTAILRSLCLLTYSYRWSVYSGRNDQYRGLRLAISSSRGRGLSDTRYRRDLWSPWEGGLLGGVASRSLPVKRAIFHGHYFAGNISRAIFHATSERSSVSIAIYTSLCRRPCICRVKTATLDGTLADEPARRTAPRADGATENAGLEIDGPNSRAGKCYLVRQNPVLHFPVLHFQRPRADSVLHNGGRSV